MKTILTVLKNALAVVGVVVAIAAAVTGFTGHLRTIVTDVRAIFADPTTPTSQEDDVSAQSPTSPTSRDADSSVQSSSANLDYQPFRYGKDAALHLTNTKADPAKVRAFFGPAGRNVYVFATGVSENPQYKFEYLNIPTPSTASGYKTYFQEPLIIPVGFAVDTKKTKRLYYLRATRQ